MNELYQRYGQLMVQFEILQGQINECKQKIVVEINKQKAMETPISVTEIAQ